MLTILRLEFAYVAISKMRPLQPPPHTRFSNHNVLKKKSFHVVIIEYYNQS